MKGISKIGSLLPKSKVYLKRSSPTILTCVSAIGVVATSVLAVKATPKAIMLIEKAEMEKSLNLRPDDESVDVQLSNIEVIRSTWKCYIPAALIGVSTIVCIFGANSLNKHNQASLTSAYAILNESYKQYRKAANEVYGEDADSNIMVEAARKTYVSADGIYLFDPDLDSEDERILFYDSHSQRYFTSTMPTVLNAQYHLNRNFALRGSTTLNEFYDFLGIDRTDHGDDIGWTDDFIDSGMLWIDFKNTYTKMEDGMECYIISSLYWPTILI